MIRLLEKNIERLLECYYKPAKPLLLGLSGGSDSLLLLHLLLKYRKIYDLKIYVAHIDHGWREESVEESKYLQEIVQSLGLKFFLKVLDKLEWKCNVEEEARNQRLSFFKEIYSSYKCQALLLGHHADDQAETVLKRVLEGASLSRIIGLREVHSIDGMNVWRPLLCANKKNIVQYLKKRKYKLFL